MSLFAPSPDNKSQPSLVVEKIEDVATQPMSAQTGSGQRAPAAGRWAATWRIATANRKAAVGLAIVLFFVLVALVGPLFLRTDPSALTNDVLLPPSPVHWLGTTQTGQDVFGQLIVGTRTSVFWGFLTGLIVTAFSVVIGLTAGYLGGLVDDVLSMLINIFLVLPSFPLAVVLAAYLPFKGPLTVSLVIAITSWAYQARVLRAQTLSMRSRDFVDASRSNGEATWRIIFFEIFPNEIAIVAAGFVGTAIYVILTAVSLEFLGLGDVSVIDWGTMFYWAQNNDALLLGAWWWYAAPGLCVALLGAGLALINFGIDELANPRLRAEKRLDKILARMPFSRVRKARVAN